MADMNLAVKISAADLNATGTLNQVSKSLNTMEAAANKAGGAAGGFTVTVLRAADATRTAVSPIDQLTAEVNKLGQAFLAGFGLQSGMAFATQIGESIRGAIDSFVEFDAQLEQSQVAWTTFLHSADAARQMIAEITHFAAVTPFRYQGIEESARLLTAMGVSAERVLPLLTDIGNAVSATGRGAEGFQRVAYVMGEINSLGQVDDRTLRQLTIDGGIPAFEMLAQAMGKSTGEIRKMASAGEITSDQFMEIFHNFVSQNWGDMMEKQSQTAIGALSTLQDNLQMLGARAVQPLVSDMRDLIVAMAHLSNSTAALAWADSIAEHFTQAANVVKTFIEVVDLAGQKLSPLGGILSALGFSVESFDDTILRGIPPLQLVISAVQSLPGFLAFLDAALGGTAAQTAQLTEGMRHVYDSSKETRDELGRMTDAAGDASQATAKLQQSMDTAKPSVDLLKQSIGELGNTYGIVAAQADALTKAEQDAAVKAAEIVAQQNALLLQSIGETGGIGAVAEAAQRIIDAEKSARVSFSGANAELKVQRDQVAELNDQLQQLKKTIDDLSHPRLAGMGAIENRIFNLQQQANAVQLRIDQAELGGGRAPAGLLAQETRLQHQIDIARLQEGLRFDRPLRALEQAANPVTEVTFGQALAGIQTAKQKYDELSAELTKAKEAVRDFATSLDQAKLGAAQGSGSGSSSSGGLESYYYGNQNVRKPTLAGAR